MSKSAWKQPAEFQASRAAAASEGRVPAIADREAKLQSEELTTEHPVQSFRSRARSEDSIFSAEREREAQQSPSPNPAQPDPRTPVTQILLELLLESKQIRVHAGKQDWLWCLGAGEDRCETDPRERSKTRPARTTWVNLA